MIMEAKAARKMHLIPTTDMQAIRRHYITFSAMFTSILGMARRPVTISRKPLQDAWYKAVLPSCRQ
jgi:hypothetical protein